MRAFVDSDASDDDNEVIGERYISEEEDDDHHRDNNYHNNSDDDGDDKPVGTIIGLGEVHNTQLNGFQQLSRTHQLPLRRNSSGSSLSATGRQSILAKVSEESSEEDAPLDPPPPLSHKKSASLGEIDTHLAALTTRSRRPFDIFSGGFTFNSRNSRSVDNLRARGSDPIGQEGRTVDKWRQSIASTADLISRKRRSVSAMDMLQSMERDKEQRRLDARTRLRDSTGNRRLSGDTLLDFAPSSRSHSISSSSTPSPKPSPKLRPVEVVAPRISPMILPVKSRSTSAVPPNPHQRQQERARESAWQQRRPPSVDYGSSVVVNNGMPIIPQGYMLVPIGYPVMERGHTLQRPKSLMELKGFTADKRGM